MGLRLDPKKLKGSFQTKKLLCVNNIRRLHPFMIVNISRAIKIVIELSLCTRHWTVSYALYTFNSYHPFQLSAISISIFGQR